MALTNPCFKDQIGLICEGRARRERIREERRRRRDEEEEDGDQASQRYGTLDFVWKLNLCMDSMRLCMNFNALLVILLPKSRVC